MLIAVIESLVWWGTGPGDPITGPRPLAAFLPLLMAVPLWWRRSRPLLVAVLVWLSVVAEIAISGHVHEGIEEIVAVGVATFAVAAYAPRREAFLGLGLTAAGYAVRSWYDVNVRSGKASELWAAAFFAAYLLALWLVGMVVQARRESTRSVARAVAVRLEADRAVAEERARIARDLHDIVAHNLSVVVVQAAGGRAQVGEGSADTERTLEKIETSGRQALGEMRRLLGVLRASDGPEVDGQWVPTPGLGELDELVRGVQSAGLCVSLAIEGDVDRVPAAVAVSAYRVVQEALTNVLKHAGSNARADVAVGILADALTLTVVDDGLGPVADGGLGHGLLGMRERVSLVGGTFEAGGLPGGGFAVTARLPIGASA